MDLVIFDVETTGLYPFKGDRICEIGAVKIRDKEIIDKFWSLINSNREISFSAYLVNKINEEMLKDAPLIDQVLPEFLNFSQGCILSAYNAKFDIGFLNNELSILNYPIKNEKDVIDIMELAKVLLPELRSYSLYNVSKYLGIEISISHRALSDALTTASVFLKLMEIGDIKELKYKYPYLFR
jgi:DNA polymerase-3 subunit alpha (Gram-positive type)